MNEVDLDSHVGVGILNADAFVVVIPPLSDEEIKVLDWAGVLGDTDEPRTVDETAGIVGIEQDGSSLEATVRAAMLKAAKIVLVFNHYKIRVETTVLSIEPLDLTDYAC